MKTKLIASAVLLSQIQLFAGETESAARDYVAHEWGTFTSVQGADGNLIQWHPLVTAQLPGFVYDRSKSTGDPRRTLTLGKDMFLARQRMETPVVYFYSGQERTVDVTVRFPKGLITEWYPYAGEIGPSWVQPNPILSKLDQGVRQTGLHPRFTFASLDPDKDIRDSLVEWPGIHVLPATSEQNPPGSPPTDQSGSHYYSARDTDANLLRVHAPGSGTPKAEYEKFLFYRGLGSFETPLQVRLNGAAEDSLELDNRGREDLSHLFVLNVQKAGGTFVHQERLPAGQKAIVKLDSTQAAVPLSALAEAVRARMRQSLEQAGLYPREAAAMVQTWRDSWFEEPGLRVLYLLPRGWTDRTLPMTITPRPKELVRVMVGRAEVISQHMEREVLKQIVQFNSADPKTKAQAVDDFQALGLGRFAEPAIRRVAERAGSRELSQAAWSLLEATKPAGAANKQFVQSGS